MNTEDQNESRLSSSSGVHYLESEFSDLINEVKAGVYLEPLDQSYTPKTALKGITFIYKLIVNATKSFLNNYRYTGISLSEIFQELEKESMKSINVKAILDYLTTKKDGYGRFVVKHYGALFENNQSFFKPVYFAGNIDYVKTLLRSDRITVENILEHARSILPFDDEESMHEFLKKEIELDDMETTWFSPKFQLDEDVDKEKGYHIYHKYILPELRKRDEILYLEIPATMFDFDQTFNPILLVHQPAEIITRYHYLCNFLLITAKEFLISLQNNNSDGEFLSKLKIVVESIERDASFVKWEALAEVFIAYYAKPDALRKIAFEIFLSRKKLEIIQEQIEKQKEHEKQIYIDILIDKIKARKWLYFIPVSFYSQEVFEEVLKTPGILSTIKEATFLGSAEDYYCIIENSMVETVLKSANAFELLVLEEILRDNNLHKQSIFKKQLFKRKKDIVFLLINPFVYLFQSLLQGKRKFIESVFNSLLSLKNNDEKVIQYFNRGRSDTLQASGLSSNIKNPPQSAKNNIVSFVMGILFPDPAPSAKVINDIEYRSRLEKAARKLKYHEDFPQYNNKSNEAIIADIEQFVKKELIADVFEGNLPTGLDYKGRKFTRKTYSPKEIKDHTIVYNTIREELEHESLLYGSKDLVEYYKKKSRIYSEQNMEKVRYEEKLRREAEIKNNSEKNTVETPKSSTKKILKNAIEMSSKESKSSAMSKETSDLNNKLQNSSSKMTRYLNNLYIKERKFSGTALFPYNEKDIEKELNLSPGTLSIFLKQNTKLFTDHYIGIKAGNSMYYFPKAFFMSKKNEIVKYYSDLIKFEETLPLPNGEIITKAGDIISTIKYRKI